MKLWIEPEEWGHLAWSVLFACCSTNNNAYFKFRLLEILPLILPCFTCCLHASKFLKNNHQKLVRATEFTKILQDFYESSGSISSLKIKPNRIKDFGPSLWIWDFYLFMASIFLVTDHGMDKFSLEKSFAIQNFLTYIFKLWPLPPQVGDVPLFETKEKAFFWLFNLIPIKQQPVLKSLIDNFKLNKIS